MFHKNISLLLMAAFVCMPHIALTNKGPSSFDTRACPTCPTPSAKFCNLCASTGVVGSLIVQDSLTLCTGVTLPCFCLFDAGLTWGPAEMLPQAITTALLAPVADTEFQPNPSAFQPYTNSQITLRGWELCNPNAECTQNLLTVQFVVPYDMDVNFFSSLFIHFFVPGLVGQSWLRFQVDIELLGFGDDTGTTSKLTLVSQNVEVFAPQTSADTLRAYSVQVPLEGLVAPLLANGQFAAITVSRIPNDEDPEDEASSVYLSALGFNYRKKQAPLI